MLNETYLNLWPWSKYLNVRFKGTYKNQQKTQVNKKISAFKNSLHAQTISYLNTHFVVTICDTCWLLNTNVRKFYKHLWISTVRFEVNRNTADRYEIWSNGRICLRRICVYHIIPVSIKLSPTWNIILKKTRPL